jgi:hypothetical protein
MITVMNMEKEFPVVFTVATSQGNNHPAWTNFCDTIFAGIFIYSKSDNEWNTLIETKLMTEHRGIIANDDDIRFKTEADLTLFLLRFS